VASDSRGLTALPFLTGERSPGWRGDAKAAVAGMSLATTAPQILRALVEAVAYRLAAVHDLLAPVASPGHAVIASGGALGHSRVFTQVLADALGVPIELLPGTEASSRGTVLLALGALGRPAPQPEPSGSLVRPDPAVATSTPPHELARVACTTALWGPAYLERIGSIDSCASRSAVTTRVFR